jgi:MFS family permease
MVVLAIFSVGFTSMAKHITSTGAFYGFISYGLGRTAGLASGLLATFAYAALSTMILNLPADLYPTRSVASVSGLSGTAAGIGTIIATYVTGFVADRYSFEPLLVGGSVIPLVAMVALLFLVRNTEATRGIVNEI